MADYSTLLRDRVTLTVRSVDRIFLQGYVPHLQTPGWCARYLREQRGFGYPSSRAFGEVGKAYEKAIRNFAEENAIPVIRFAKGDNREEIARPYLEAAAAAGGKGTVALIGVGQEKASAWRSWAGKKRDHRGRPLQEWGRQMTFVSHFYFYLWDAEWGPAFWKVNCYAPFPVWIWLNGHEWAKRQLDKARIGYAALDNGFRSCDKPALLQRLCDRLGPGAVSGFFWRWFPRLPQVFTAVDLRAGYVCELAFRQFEVADTRVFSRPAAGRAFFEGLIRDHLDIGRPDCVSLTFGRRVLATTPGAFRTKVVTEGVDPQVSCYYKASRIKQYFKGHRALRTETVICDTRKAHTFEPTCARWCLKFTGWRAGCLGPGQPRRAGRRRGPCRGPRRRAWDPGWRRDRQAGSPAGSGFRYRPDPAPGPGTGPTPRCAGSWCEW